MVLDIETIPLEAYPGLKLTAEGLGLTIPEPEPKPEPTSYTGAKLEAWRVAEVQRLADARDTAHAEAVDAWARGSLDWRRARVLCVGLGWDDGVVVLYGEEVEILRSLTDRLAQHRGEVWAFGGFDGRILRSAYLRHNLPIPPILRVGQKPWERRWRDLQHLAAEVLTGGDLRGVSVDALCEHLQIERYPSPVTGREVLRAYVEGRVSEVYAHCHADVVDELAILARLGGAL